MSMTQILKPKILVTEALAYFEEEKKILEKFALVKLADNSSEEAILKETEDATIIMVVLAVVYVLMLVKKKQLHIKMLTCNISLSARQRLVYRGNMFFF